MSFSIDKMTKVADNKRVVVFGGSGFLGGHIADCLSQHGFKVTIADIVPPKRNRNDQEFVSCDILKLDQILEIIRGAEYVYNIAALADIEESAQNPVKTVEVNILGNTYILEACRRYQVKRFVFASSVYVSSHKGSFYRSSKQACEKIIENYSEQFGLPYTILRYGSLYGPRANQSNSLRKYIRQALECGKISRTGDGEEMREYIHVLDAAQCSVLALHEEYRNQCLLITGMQAMRVKDVLGMIREIMGSNVEIEYLPAIETSHYTSTPYSFRPDSAHRLVMNRYYDLGQGLYDLLHEIQAELTDSQAKIAE
jgi:UDP-glucose 4-epimerase